MKTNQRLFALVLALLMSLCVALAGMAVAEAAEEAGQESDVAVDEPAEGAANDEAEADDAAAALPEGVVPVTWEVTPEHPMIDTDEARALYQQFLAGDYLSMEELVANPVVQQLDALSAYYKSIYGNTADIDTPEREALREELKDWFLTLGSARTESVDENGKHHYVYDGPLNRDYQMILALGLPASGKSTFIADPDSEAMGAFILDPDVIKARISGIRGEPRRGLGFHPLRGHGHLRPGNQRIPDRRHEGREHRAAHRGRRLRRDDAAVRPAL